MELSEAFRKRRSIRHYIQKEVSTQKIEEIIAAGTLAPSAHHREPWEVLVLREQKKKISSFMRNHSNKEDISIVKTADTIDRADTLLLIYCNNFEQFEYNLLSLGAMIENMLLQATELGIGSLWIGNVCAVEKEINGFLKIDSKQKKLVSAVALGYYEQEPKELKRKTVSEITKYIL